ncbi:MAG: hypothetical protein VX341_08675 [Bdellovibrionota bacterium]|nr:hypothetical protein [Bdellovibrionota bacterium]
MGRDLGKENLYESVKTLVECEESHILLAQPKLYTLFSIAFQYMLFQSQKTPGAYIIRIEDSKLAEKLARKSKDPSTRKFLQSILIPRKLKYGKSMFYVDFFNINSWNMTAELPPEKIKGAIIVKDTNDRPMTFSEESEADVELKQAMATLPENYYLEFIKDVCQKTIMISFEGSYEGLHPINFPFIKKEETKTISGVTIGKDISWDNID